jgi:hypothetical protein
MLAGAGCFDLGDQAAPELPSDGGDDLSMGQPDLPMALPDLPVAPDLPPGTDVVAAPDLAPPMMDIPPPPPPSPSFSGEIQPIFTSNCAVTMCHVSGSGNVNGLFLEVGLSYNLIVNKASAENPPQKRVEPGMPDNSYLYRKITNSPGIVLSAMPPSPRPMLLAQSIATIRAWITAGAPNN